MKTTAIIPVKKLGNSNERLADAFDPPTRRMLAEAMFFDTLAAVRHVKVIDSILIVTADQDIIRQARWANVDVLVQDSDEGHSAAAAAGVAAAMADGAERVAILPIDCPQLDSASLDSHMGRTPRSALIVPDHHGTGTNALILCPPDAFAPSFGPGSCARHIGLARAAGVGFSVEKIAGMDLDLDTPEDLEALRDRLILEPGEAPRTAEILCYRDLDPLEPATSGRAGESSTTASA